MNSISINGSDGEEYQIVPLTKALAQAQGERLIQIHNIIPYVHWQKNDLLAASSPKGVAYNQKWELSSVVFYGDQIVGLLVAYLREASEMHPLRAIYIHRLAIDSEYQGRGIGSQLVREMLDYYAREFPHATAYTVQTNDEEANEKVISFYEEAGFERFLPVRYPEKLDILLKLERSELPARAKRQPSGIS